MLEQAAEKRVKAKIPSTRVNRAKSSSDEMLCWKPGDDSENIGTSRHWSYGNSCVQFSCSQSMGWDGN